MSRVNDYDSNLCFPLFIFFLLPFNWYALSTYWALLISCTCMRFQFCSEQCGERSLPPSFWQGRKQRHWGFAGRGGCKTSSLVKRGISIGGSVCGSVKVLSGIPMVAAQREQWWGSCLRLFSKAGLGVWFWKVCPQAWFFGPSKDSVNHSITF